MRPAPARGKPELDTLGKIAEAPGVRANYWRNERGRQLWRPTFVVRAQSVGCGPSYPSITMMSISTAPARNAFASVYSGEW
jgi:hypothetical protein